MHDNNFIYMSLYISVLVMDWYISNVLIIIMAEQDLIEKLAGRSLKESIFYDNRRLKGILFNFILAIEAALASMKDINRNYLKKY
jgi:hypothetical protein